MNNKKGTYTQQKLPAEQLIYGPFLFYLIFFHYSF